MLSAFLQGGSRWQNLPACHGTVTITIQEVGDCHSRPKCCGYCPLCLLGSQCNWTVDRVWHKKRSLMATCSFLCRVVRRNEGVIFCRGVIFWYALTWCDTVYNSLGMANQLHEKHGRLDTFIKLFGILNSKSEILLSNCRIPEKSQPKILKWLIISLSSCMIWPVRMKLLASTASIYLHRWIAQYTIANLHEMPCCNILTGGCHSQTYGHIAWHSTKMIKICYIRVGFWWNTAPVKGFVLGTFIRAKNATFYVQIYIVAKGIVKIRLIDGLCLMTSVIL